MTQPFALSDLPEDVLRMIIRRLAVHGPPGPSAHTLTHLAQTCRELHALVTDMGWRAYFLSRMGALALNNDRRLPVLDPINDPGCPGTWSDLARDLALFLRTWTTGGRETSDSDRPGFDLHFISEMPTTESDEDTDGVEQMGVAYCSWCRAPPQYQNNAGDAMLLVAVFRYRRPVTEPVRRNEPLERQWYVARVFVLDTLQCVASVRIDDETLVKAPNFHVGNGADEFDYREESRSFIGRGRQVVLLDFPSFELGLLFASVSDAGLIALSRIALDGSTPVPTYFDRGEPWIVDVALGYVSPSPMSPNFVQFIYAIDDEQVIVAHLNSTTLELEHKVVIRLPGWGTFEFDDGFPDRVAVIDDTTSHVVIYSTLTGAEVGRVTQVAKDSNISLFWPMLLPWYCPALHGPDHPATFTSTDPMYARPEWTHLHVNASPIDWYVTSGETVMLVQPPSDPAVLAADAYSWVGGDGSTPFGRSTGVPAWQELAAAVRPDSYMRRVAYNRAFLLSAAGTLATADLTGTGPDAEILHVCQHTTDAWNLRATPYTYVPNDWKYQTFTVGPDQHALRFRPDTCDCLQARTPQDPAARNIIWIGTAYRSLAIRSKFGLAVLKSRQY
ncbi:hypothetical protein BC828DRAFT_382901 [Blastocladiella britannica]|nr:hypothetical protein BC828DRAFT_382901 [Blastocladiella britannica]